MNKLSTAITTLAGIARSVYGPTKSIAGALSVSDVTHSVVVGLTVLGSFSQFASELFTLLAGTSAAVAALTHKFLSDPAPVAPKS